MSVDDPSEHEAAVRDARRRAGAAIRDLGHAFIGRHATLEQIERLADVLEGISAELWPLDHRSRGEQAFARPPETEYPQGRFSHAFADRPVSGSASPSGL
ncbi:MAG: hypothetical protein ACO23O_13435, partial [Ilumatobacteraceae bacterium]